jgi:hypothetical protein
VSAGSLAVWALSARLDHLSEPARTAVFCLQHLHELDSIRPDMLTPCNQRKEVA